MTSVAKCGRLSLTVLGALTLLLTCQAPALADTTCGSGGYDSYAPAPPNTSPSIICSLGNLVFGNFGFHSTASGGASLPTPGSVSVTTVNTPGDEGLSFNLGLTAASDQSQEVIIQFEVSGANGALVEGLSTFFTGSESGTGFNNSAFTFCTQSFSTGCDFTFVVPQNPVRFDIAPQNMLFITAEFLADGGTNGTATTSGFTTQFPNLGGTTPVFEPGCLVLLCTGLLGMAGALGKKKALK
jgi:hypothetical protein